MKVDKARGMNVSVVTSAKTDEIPQAAAAHRAAIQEQLIDGDHGQDCEGTEDSEVQLRLRNRCKLCGRPRAYMRKFALCRLCFRKAALEGDVTGVTKSSW